MTVPVVDVERRGAAPVVFMSMLSNLICRYNSRTGCAMEYKSFAICVASHCRQAMLQGL